MIAFIRLFSLTLLVFLTSQSWGIATPVEHTSCLYDVNHIVFARQKYDYEATHNFRYQCINATTESQEEKATERYFCALFGDFIATNKHTKA